MTTVQVGTIIWTMNLDPALRTTATRTDELSCPSWARALAFDLVTRPASQGVSIILHSDYKNFISAETQKNT